MDYSNLVQFVPEQLGILVASLLVFGTMLKSTNKIQDAYIPFILIVLGIIGSVLMMGTSVTSVLQGIIATAVAVYGKNILKQSKEILGSKDIQNDVQDIVKTEETK